MEEVRSAGANTFFTLPISPSPDFTTAPPPPTAWGLPTKKPLVNTSIIPFSFSNGVRLRLSPDPLGEPSRFREDGREINLPAVLNDLLELALAHEAESSKLRAGHPNGSAVADPLLVFRVFLFSL